MAKSLDGRLVIELVSDDPTTDEGSDMTKRSARSAPARIGAALALAAGLFVADASLAPDAAEAAIGCLYTDLGSSSVNNITCGRLAHGYKSRPSPTAPTTRSGNWVGPLAKSSSGACYAYPSVVKG